MSEQTCRFSLNVLTINIHKGFTTFNRRFMLPALRDAIRSVSADIVCLQEVTGAHEIHSLQIENWPDRSHYEFLADSLWSEYAYGRNAVYPEGHHGNAVLSRFPIEYTENVDISVGDSEKRGLLYCRIVAPQSTALHLFCVHLGLRTRQRLPWRFGILGCCRTAVCRLVAMAGGKRQGGENKGEAAHGKLLGINEP